MQLRRIVGLRDRAKRAVLDVLESALEIGKHGIGHVHTSSRWRPAGADERADVARTLLLLDLGYTVTAAAEAPGTYRRETARIGKRYLAGGLAQPSAATLVEGR